MINFPCKCGYAFSLPADQAGGVIQCPQCNLLADVPTLNDLANMHPDGTIAFGDPAPLPDNMTAADLHYAFTNKTVDARGFEKDLRHNAEEIAAIGLEEHIAPRPSPRYDPITGELIRPLQLVDEKPIPVLSIGEVVDPSQVKPEDLEMPLPVEPIPAGTVVAAPRKLGYALGDARKQVTLKTLAVELLMPANVAVMFFVFLTYVLGFYATSGIASYSERFFRVVWPFLIVNIAMWLVISHIGCVIEETGPEAVDELPRPLRNMSPGEDVLTPMFRTILAGILCFWPTVIAIRHLDPMNPVTVPIVCMLFLAGAFFFPAVVLTTVTGTTILNLRPDRLLAVIRLCGGNYLLSMLLCLLGIVPSIYYFAGELLFDQELHGPFFRKINQPTIMLPIMMATVYFLHFFCWHLGLMYREHHARFPWLAQRHVRESG